MTENDHSSAGSARTIPAGDGATLAAPPGSDPSSGTSPAPALALPERYRDLRVRIAVGGSAEVRRVRDALLDRDVALKLLHWDNVDNEDWRRRFLDEAQVTASLQHPGIVPVYDRGELPDGRLWFTMKEVRGRTLEEVIEEVHAASGPDGFRTSATGWTFRRLVDAFARIAQAVGYAHSRGIVHRDLKPVNLMVGEFGEVLVMDWGLARRVGTPYEQLPGARDGAPISAAGRTRHGAVLGTPAYMPPEQARGDLDRHGAASDVYALGVILHHLLVGRPPYTGKDDEAIWRQVVAGPPLPILEAARGGPPVPAELVAIAERAMQREIGARFPDGDAVATELVTWLDGAKRRELALAELERARALEPIIAGLRARVAAAEAEARALLDPLRPFDSVEMKRPGWLLERTAKAHAQEAAIHTAEWIRIVHGALSQDPDLPEAHAALADHYRDELAAAELAHREEDAARIEVLLRSHARGRHGAFLRGDAALTLLTGPPGALVIAHRFEPFDHRLVPGPAVELGATPLLEVPLARGSYLLRILASGRAEVRYPILLERGGHWDGRAPNEDAPRAVTLPAVGELGPDDIYVPGGPCWTGGDPAAIDGLPSRRIWIDAFVVRRFPVTNLEYIEFLNDLLRVGREAEALRCCPAATGAGGVLRPDLHREAGGPFRLKEGGVWRPDHPVVLIDWHAASAYVEWLRERTGLPWRLLNELEREKAARGVDARKLPWGDEPEATYARVAESDEEPRLVSVHDHPLDESPYGVRGLAGNVRDWCVNLWRRQGPPLESGRLALDAAAPQDTALRAVRGGAWGSPLTYSRAACRFGAQPGYRHVTTGFRLARSCSS